MGIPFIISIEEENQGAVSGVQVAQHLDIVFDIYAMTVSVYVDIAVKMAGGINQKGKWNGSAALSSGVNLPVYHRIASFAYREKQLVEKQINRYKLYTKFITNRM